MKKKKLEIYGSKENFGCAVHRRVFFTRQEMEEHLIEKNCHPENIVKLKGEDFIGRWCYNMLEESLENSTMSKEEKEGVRQTYNW